MKNLWGLAALCVVVAGCAGPRLSASAEAEAAAAQRKAAEARAGYVIGPDDVLAINVYQDKDLATKAHVDANGEISVPLAGAVKVGGATLDEARKRVEQALDRFIVRPQVSLSVDQYGSKQLFVLGEVQKPGPYPVPSGGKVTLLQAISDAGGFTKGAAPRRTHVLRYVGGKSRDLKVDLKSLISSGDREKDLILEPNDVVYVPQTLF